LLYPTHEVKHSSYFQLQNGRQWVTMCCNTFSFLTSLASEQSPGHPHLLLPNVH